MFNIFRRISKRKQVGKERRRLIEERRRLRKAMDDYLRRIQSIKSGEKNHEDP